MRLKTTLLLASTLAVTASPLVMADAHVNVNSEVVRYDDLRLISAVGAAVLYGRLRGAAERVCGGPVDSLPPSQKARFRACVDDAVAKAVAQVNAPVLTQYVESKRSATVPSGATDAGVTAAGVTPVAKAR